MKTWLGFCFFFPLLLWGQTQPFHFSHAQLELHSFFSTDTLYGKTTWTFYRNNSASEIYFLLNPALQIKTIQDNGQNAQSRMVQDSIFITLDSNLTHSVSIEYQGIPDSSGFGSYMKATHESGEIIWTLSEPFGAKDWFPSRQILSEKIDSVDIWITTDSGYTAVSNGVLMNQTYDNKQVTFHWKHTHPIAYYLLGIAISNYQVYQSTENGLRWENYVFPHDTASFTQNWYRILRIMDVFEQLTIPYPFRNEKYGHAQFPWGGGMEHQTISFVYSFDFELIAHEMAHQWFGDYITCGSWQDLWLNEGFASYFSGIAWEKIEPSFLPVFFSVRLKRVLEQPNGAVYAQDTSVLSNLFLNRLRYHKSCLVLHQLRGQIGDDAFFQAIKSYLNDPTLAYSTATTADFMRHVQKYTDYPVQIYFDQWIYKEGYPTFTVHYSYQPNQTLIKLEQSTSDPSVSLFPLKVPIRLYSASRMDSLDIWLPFEQNGQIFEIPTPQFISDSIALNPDYWIIADTTRYLPWDISNPLLFPNPSHGKLTLVESADIQECMIFDIAGKKIYETQPAHSIFHWEGNLPQGVYVVRWKTRNQWKTSRWLIVE